MLTRAKLTTIGDNVTKKEMNENSLEKSIEMTKKLADFLEELQNEDPVASFLTIQAFVEFYMESEIKARKKIHEIMINENNSGKLN